MFFCDFDLINESFERKWKLAKVEHQKSTYFRLQTKGEKIPGGAGAYPVYRLCGYTPFGEWRRLDQVTGAGLNIASWLCKPHWSENVFFRPLATSRIK